jgi:hypothetical protein
MERHIYELPGQILAKTQRRHYQGQFKGQPCYELLVKIRPSSAKPPFFNNFIRAVRTKILDDNIWNDICEANYADKKYLFFCHKDGQIYKLVDWKELKS